MDDEPFYIGYLPKAPPTLTRFTQKTVAGFAAGALLVGAAFAFALPYFGQGSFDFGQHRDFKGRLRCDAAPRLAGAEADYLLVGYGKNRVAPEICGAADGSDVVLRGTLIERDGRRLIEVNSLAQTQGAIAPAPAPIPLGRFTLTGEIVDSKCYFGVMNPAEGRAHRACAVLCLRGGVPAVFVARDRSGATLQLIVTGPEGTAINESLLRWVAEPVEATGEVVRQGKWLVFRIDPASLRYAGS